MRRREGWAAFAAGCVVLGGVSCAGEALRVDVPPVTVARPVRRSARGDAGVVEEPREIVRRVAEPVPVPLPVFGDGGVKPTDAHAFRMAIAVKAARANASGLKVLQIASALRSVDEARSRTGVDPFADGEWLLAYGPRVEAPWSNVNVLRHARPDGDVTRAIGDAGMEPAEAGAGAVWSEMFGVRDVLLRPQAGVLALVPSDRAAELAGALKAPIDPGVKGGELARVAFAEPGRLVRFLPVDLARGLVVVRPTADGGLDVSAEADCPDAAKCATTSTDLEELVRRQNSIMVRFVTKNLLGGVRFRADGTKLRATLHANPDQVDALVNLVRPQLDVVVTEASDGGSP